MVEAEPSTVNLNARPGSTIPAPVGARGQRSVAAASAPVVAAWLRSRSRAAPPWRNLSMRLMAPRCLFCGQAADLGAVDLCLDCLEALPWNESGIESMDDSAAGIGLEFMVPLRYAPPVDAALRDLKFHGDLAPARVLGAVLAAVAASWGPLPDLLVPVPLHAARLHERGFNQAAHIARAAARWLDRPCAPRLLERRRSTLPQTSLDAATRRRNVVGAFTMSAGAARWLQRRASPVRHIALVDDVRTTGATIQAAAAALGGVAVVSCWALAQPTSTFFTPGPPAS